MRLGLGVPVRCEQKQSSKVSILPDFPVTDKPKQAVMPEELTIHN